MCINDTWLIKRIKAATIVAVFFLLIGANSAPKANKKEVDASGTIERAQNLLESGQRKEAVELLHQKLQALKGQKSEQARIERFLNKSTRIFLTEQAQKTFERAESLYFNDKPEATAAYEQAKQLEPFNMSAILGLVRSYLAMGACDKALSEVERAEKEVWPKSKELEFYRRQGYLCSGEPASESELNTDITAVSGGKASEVYAVFSGQHCAMQNFEKAISTAKAGIRVDVAYPESYYWLWKAQQALDRPALKAARRYLSLCQSVPTSLRRKYVASPRLCRQQDKVNDYVKAQQKQ